MDPVELEQEDPRPAPKHMLVLCLGFMALESFSYFTLNNVFTLHLTDLLQQSDSAAGAYFGMRGALSMVYGTLLGPVIDWVGARRVLPFAFTLAAIGRTVFAVADSLAVTLFAVYVPMAMGHGLTFTALSIYIKKLTADSVQAASWGFGLGYVALVFGILVCGPVIDLSTSMAAPNKPYRQLAMMTAVCSAIGAVVSTASTLCWPDPMTVASKTPTFQATLDTVCTKRFVRFTAFSIAILPACSVIRNLDGGILPKYLIRTFGDTVPKGSIYAINPAIDMIAVPIVTARLSAVPHFAVLRVGFTVAAISPVVLVVLGASIPAVILFVVALTVGDFLYNPRVNAYSMAVAPAGREGMFAGVASAATFLAEIPAGLLGGWLLERHCAQGVECDGAAMFGELGMFAMITPVCLWGCSRLLREPDEHVRGSHEHMPIPMEDEEEEVERVEVEMTDCGVEEVEGVVAISSVNHGLSSENN